MSFKLRGRIVGNFGNYYEFSKVVDEHETFICKVVRGHRTLSEKQKEKWAKALNCKPKELFE